MERIAVNKLTEVVYVNEEKCINCHACIAACPVKYCNNGSGSAVSINSDMCIACGKCLKVCTHDARCYSDDFLSFIASIEKGEKIIVGTAPSIVANFPDTRITSYNVCYTKLLRVPVFLIEFTKQYKYSHRKQVISKAQNWLKVRFDNEKIKVVEY